MKNEKVYSLLDIEYYTAEEFLEKNSGEGKLFYCRERVLHEHEEFIDIDKILECIQTEAQDNANEHVCDYLGFPDNNKEFLKSQIADCLNSYLYQEYCTSLAKGNAEEYVNRVKDLGLDKTIEDENKEAEYLEYLDLLPEVSEEDGRMPEGTPITISNEQGEDTPYVYVDRKNQASEEQDGD